MVLFFPGFRFPICVRKMKCFGFSNAAASGEEAPPPPLTRGSASGRSNSTASTDREMRRSGSDFNSQNVSEWSADSGRYTSCCPSYPHARSDLRVFTFSELKSATKGFSRSLMVGEGGFGCVYRAAIKSFEDPSAKIEVAVKQLSRNGNQGHKEWLTEVNVLGVVEHPYLVKLIGYCAEDDERGAQRLLVYEFMPNRSVEYHLSAQSVTVLTWATRLRIALHAASGLAYLHEEMDFQIIFRDLKTSNILLDADWNAKLSDFGLARQGPGEGLSHVSTAIVGTMGYAAPEYVKTGRLTAKSDIWSYGVVLFELITGRRPLDRNRPRGEQNMLEWVKPYLSDAHRFGLIFDPRLQSNYSLKSATRLAAIASRCLSRYPKSRPKMSEVVEMVRRVAEEAATGDPQPPVVACSAAAIVAEDKTASSGARKKGLILKRRIASELRISGEGRRTLVWQRWRPKLMRTC